MGWPASLLVAALTAAIGAVLAGFLANAAVGWYRITSFEGYSGYFVVGLAMLGLVGGLIIGVVTSRLVAGSASPGMLRAFGLAIGATIAVIGAVGVTARLLADVPPRLEGEALMLAVEIQLPEGGPVSEGGAILTADSGGADGWWVRLSAGQGRTIRTSRKGPLWRDDARFENGRWIVPGAVEVFTSRGDRILDVLPAGILDQGFIVPLPARPRAAQLEWSEWLPVAPTPPVGVRYRFRVVPRTEPIRTQAHGPFEIATIATAFGESRNEHGVTWSATARLEVRHRGEEVRIGDDEGWHNNILAAAAVGSAESALLVRHGDRHSYGSCYLITTDNGTHVTLSMVASCGPVVHAMPLTADTTVFRRARERTLPQGRFDRTLFTDADHYLFDNAVLDVVNQRVLLVAQRHDRLVAGVAPLGISPDGASFIRLAYAAESWDDVALVVDNVNTGDSYTLDVDRSRMRFSGIRQLDPGWVLHYFAWQASVTGYRLVTRTDVTPRPHQGVLSADDGSGYREYRIGPALPELHTALIEFLLAEMGAQRPPINDRRAPDEVRIGDVAVRSMYNDKGHHVTVWLDRGTDTRPLSLIADGFNAALSSGRYDHLFTSR